MSSSPASSTVSFLTRVLPIAVLASALWACKSEAPAVDRGPADLTTVDAPPAPADATPDAGSPRLGGPCWTDADCPKGGQCWSTRADGFPGGYCVIPGCTSESCPAGSKCWKLKSGSATVCAPTCTQNSDCRQKEGYVCSSGKCWPGTATVPAGGSCGFDDQCAGPQAGCIAQAGFVGGYCVSQCASSAPCPAGSDCRAILTAGQLGCVATCQSDADCRQGYACVADPSSAWNQACHPGCAVDKDCPSPFGCRGKMCVDISDECGASNPFGDCPTGTTCEGGQCGPFVCHDTQLEPNSTPADARPLPTADTPGFQICDPDHDWYSFSPDKADTIHVVGIDSNTPSGKLRAVLATSEFPLPLSSAFEPTFYNKDDPVGPTNLKVFSLLGAPGSPALLLHVSGVSGASNNYGIVSRAVPYQDGPDCIAAFGVEECLARTTAGARDPSKLIPFPAGNANDSFVGDGVFFGNALYVHDKLANIYTQFSRLWARRELIMIVRNAIHAVQTTFPGTTPLGIGDIGLYNGNDPDGHAKGTHYDGANMDVAYYIAPAYQGTHGNMVYRQICCDAPITDLSCMELANASSPDYGTCKAGNKHIVDLPRSAYFLAKVAASGRVRVVGLEAKIEADVRVALDQLATGASPLITAAERDAAKKLMATAKDDPSWIWHSDHWHISLLTDPPSGAGSGLGFGLGGFQGPWPGVDRTEQARRARTQIPGRLRRLLGLSRRQLGGRRPLQARR